MKLMLLVVLAVAGQVAPSGAPAALGGMQAPALEAGPARTDAGTASSDEDMGHLGVLAAPDMALPEALELKRLLGVAMLDVEALRSRRAELLAEANRSRAGAPNDGGPAWSGGEEREFDAQRNMLLLALTERALARAEVEAQRADEMAALVEVQRLARARAEAERKSAEEAQRRALEEAQRARNELSGRLYKRLARIEGERAELSAARALLHKESERDLEEMRQAAERAQAALEQARVPAPGAADDRFLDLLTQEGQVLEKVALALERRAGQRPADSVLRELRAEVARDRQAVTPFLTTDTEGELGAALGRLETALDELERMADELQRDSAARGFTVAQKRMGVATTLDAARLLLLPRLSGERADALRSFTEMARDNLAVAARRVGLEVRLHVVRRRYDAARLPERFTGLFEAGGIVWTWSQALFLLGLAIWLWRRAPDVFTRVRAGVLGKSRSAARARLWEQFLALVAAAAPRAFVMAIALWISDVLGEHAPRPEVDVLVEMILWIAGYQLAAGLCHMLVLRLARRRLSLNVHQKLKTLRSVRLLMRYGFLTAWALSEARALVGPGVLYEAVQRLATLAALPLFITLIQRWRQDIVEAYLRGWPETRLGRAVRAAEGQWYAFFVASAAFAFVASKAALMLGRDFILGFEQTRRALAYLFRLRIERQARERARPAFDLAALPERVRAAFDDAPNPELSRTVPRFPGLEEAVRRLDGERSSGRLLLVHGPYGVGRTTWLHGLEAQLGKARPIEWVRPERRLTESASLLMLLRDALSLEDASSASRCAASLRKAPPRIVLLDGLEWLFLRRVGGYAALDALFEVTRATRGHISWVLTAPDPAFRHLSRARLLDEQASELIHLPPWSEGDIRMLIQQRQRASGHPVSFEDLLVHDVEGVEEGLEEAVQVVETEEGYIRLLWNFAEGNPRVAQHFWLRSLVPTLGGKLKVNLYETPSANNLEPLPAVDRFVLAAFVLHRALDVEEAVSTCDLPFGVVEAHVLRGLDLGIYREVAGGEGRFCIDVHWWEAVLRFLRRKKLL